MISTRPRKPVEVDARIDPNEREGAGALCWMVLAMIVAGIAVLLVVVASRL